jgi:hypothetical protein
MAQPSVVTTTQGPNHCIFDASNKLCSYPESCSSQPSVFIISSTEYQSLVEWFIDVFKRHVRTEDDKQLDIIYFNDTSAYDFCSNVCKPLHESWFCIAIIKEEKLPQYVKRGGKEIVSSFITRFNPNVFFEVGLALAWKKDIIIYNGEKQELPTDWGNLIKWVIKEQPLFLSTDIEEKVKEIIKKNPFMGHPVKWVD